MTHVERNRWANRERPGSRSKGDPSSAAVVIQQRARGNQERRNYVQVRDRRRALEKKGEDARTVRANEAADEAALLLERLSRG